MLSGKQTCNSCDKKSKKSFNFCPFCGHSFNGLMSQANGEDYGLLGRTDSANAIGEEIKLPFGMGKIVNSLVKQLEKQMSDPNLQNGGAQGMPKGFRINVTTGSPGMNQPNQVMQPKPEIVEQLEPISSKEQLRRSKLKRIDAPSKMKRLADKIVYEINTPGVKSRKDVSVTELASGIEVKAFSKKECHVKFIPIAVEAIEYYLENEKVFLEMKC